MPCSHIYAFERDILHWLNRHAVGPIQVPEEFRVGPFGEVTRKAFREFPEDEYSVLNMSSVPVSSEIFEWIDLASAVRFGEPPLTFLELGAGYGRWAVRFWALAGRMQKEVEKIVLVEPEPNHAAWSIQNLVDNKVNSERSLVIEAAVSAGRSRTQLYVGRPPEVGSSAPKEWYGQALVEATNEMPHRPKSFVSRNEANLMPGWETVPVKTVSLTKILKLVNKVALIDFDIQNSEASVIRSSIQTLNRKVSMVHIATHSISVETSLRELFGRHGWVCIRDYSLGTDAFHPEFGNLKLMDGVQTWVNVRQELGQELLNAIGCETIERDFPTSGLP